jgi:hypothetical protein
MRLIATFFLSVLIVAMFSWHTYNGQGGLVSAQVEEKSYPRIVGGDNFGGAVDITAGIYQLDEPLNLQPEKQTRITLKNLNVPVLHDGSGGLQIGDAVRSPKSTLQIWTADESRLISLDAQGDYDEKSKHITALENAIGERERATGFRGSKETSNTKFVYLRIGTNPDGLHGTHRDTIIEIDDGPPLLEPIRESSPVSSALEERPFLPEESSPKIPKAVGPVSAVVGIGAGLANTLSLTSSVKSFHDLYLLLARLFGAILGFFGLRRKHKPWGVVYDSMTKQPIDPAYVTAIGEKESDAITDLDGRYGFFLPQGSYRLEAKKTHYVFPSKVLAGKKADQLYKNLYFGEEITMGGEEILAVNIPMDQTGFDWNEFVKNKEKIFRLHSRWSRIKSIVLDGLYILGFLLTLFTTIKSPGLLNYIILALYIVLFLALGLWRHKKKVSTVSFKKSGQPLSFAVIRIFLANIDQEVKKVVTNEFGKFYILVAPGNYYLTVESKEADGSYKLVHRSKAKEFPSGVIRGDIQVTE